MMTMECGKVTVRHALLIDNMSLHEHCQVSLFQFAFSSTSLALLSVNYNFENLLQPKNMNNLWVIISIKRAYLKKIEERRKHQQIWFSLWFVVWYKIYFKRKIYSFGSFGPSLDAFENTSSSTSSRVEVLFLRLGRYYFKLS